MGINGETFLAGSDLSPIFSKFLHNPNKCLTFAAQEPAKPLNDAKIGGSFYFMKYNKEYSSPSELISILQSRGLDCCDIDNAIDILSSQQEIILH